MNYYSHHIGDYSAATAHLSWIEDMAYTRLMRLYYQSEKPIPSDVKRVCTLVRATSKVERQAVESVLQEFFTLEADGWHQKRCDEEILRMQEKSEKARTSVGARWAKRTHNECNTNVDTNVLRPQYEGNTPNSQYPIKKENIIPAEAGAALWEFGVTVLMEQGLKEGSARAFLGSMLRDYEESHVESALRSAVGKANAKAYIMAVLKDLPKKGQQMSIV